MLTTGSVINVTVCVCVCVCVCVKTLLSQTFFYPMFKDHSLNDDAVLKLCSLLLAFLCTSEEMEGRHHRIT